MPAIKSYAVKQADNRRIDCRMAVDEEYNLVVLNLNLPKLNSLSILKGLRRERLQTAEAILADYPHVLRIFVYADSDAKHKHVEMLFGPS